MKKNLGIVIAIIGLMIIMFPTFIKIYNKTRQTKVIIDQKAVQRTEEELQKQAEKRKEEEEYNKQLYEENKFLTEALLTEVPDGVTSFNATNLGDMLSVITIPKINVMLPVYEGTSAEVLQFGVGHITSSSYPIGGIGTHCILTGHTGLNTNKLFDDLIDLQIRDQFYLETGDEKLYYEVDKIDVVLPEETSSIVLDPEQDYVTLVTCTPIYVNSHRLLVRGKRIEIDEVSIDEYTLKTTAEQQYDSNKKDLIQLIVAFVGVILLIVYNANYLEKYLARKRYYVVDDDDDEDDEDYLDEE